MSQERRHATVRREIARGRSTESRSNKSRLRDVDGVEIRAPVVRESKGSPESQSQQAKERERASEKEATASRAGENAVDRPNRV